MSSSCSCNYVKWSRWVVDILAQLYFFLVTSAFKLVNLFAEKKIVPPVTDPLLLKSVKELRQLIKNRKVASSQILESYIKRIEEVNPIINAVVFKNFEEAREEAKLVDQRIENLNDEQLSELMDSQPLLGLPFTLKDSMMIKGKPCTVGLMSRFKANEMMPEDAAVVHNMKNAGGIFLATTTVPETCLWVEVFTKPYGRTNNPYDSRRIVGGSSGGEGALHGSGATLMGIGSDMGGSIRIPSYMNGIFGMMCTPGKVSPIGHIPGAPEPTYKYQMGKLGPMTRFAEDLPLLIDVLSGSTVTLDTKNNLKNIKLYYLEGITHNKRIEPLQDQPLQSMKAAVKHFEDKFGITAQCLAFPETDDLLNMYGVSIFEEGEPNFSYFLKDLTKPTEPVNCYLELAKAIFGQSEYSIYVPLLCLAPWFNGFSSEQHKVLRAKRDKFKARVLELLGDDGVIFYPSWPTVPPFHYETVAKQTTFPYTGMWNMLSVPAIQCPMGLKDGIPTGVQVYANHNNENLLIDIAQEISEAFGGWVNPGDMKKYH